MTISRRTFLGAATGAVASFLPQRARPDPGRGNPCFVPRTAALLDCVLLDLGEHCGLRESLAGFEAALHESGARFVRAEAGCLPRSQTLIVPGVTMAPPKVFRRLSASLQDGTCLLLESGAGFLDRKEFTLLQAGLWTHFAVEVKTPVDLWRVIRESLCGPPDYSFMREHRQGALLRSKLLKGAAGESSLLKRKPGAFPCEQQQRVPYVDLVWPQRAKIRDFSRAVPLAAQAGDIIGWADGLPVALKRNWGNGTLIFLGSPLGPSLRAGDREARGWLERVLMSA